jgi:hypothetical protein
MGKYVTPASDEPDPEATALIAALHELTTDAAVNKWRFLPATRDKMTALQARAPAEFDRVEAAVEGWKKHLNGGGAA